MKLKSLSLEFLRRSKTYIAFKIPCTKLIFNFQRVFLVMHESVRVYDITLCVYRNVQICTQTKLYTHKCVHTHTALTCPCKKKVCQYSINGRLEGPADCVSYVLVLGWVGDLHDDESTPTNGSSLHVQQSV